MAFPGRGKEVAAPSSPEPRPEENRRLGGMKPDTEGVSRVGKSKWEESTFGLTRHQMPFGPGINTGVNVNIGSERPILPFTYFVFSADNSVATF